MWRNWEERVGRCCGNLGICFFIERWRASGYWIYQKVKGFCRTNDIITTSWGSTNFFPSSFSLQIHYITRQNCRTFVQSTGTNTVSWFTIKLHWTYTTFLYLKKLTFTNILSHCQVKTYEFQVKMIEVQVKIIEIQVKIVYIRVKIDANQVKIIEFPFKLICHFKLKLQFKKIEIAT